MEDAHPAGSMSSDKKGVCIGGAPCAPALHTHADS